MSLNSVKPRALVGEFIDSRNQYKNTGAMIRHKTSNMVVYSSRSEPHGGLVPTVEHRPRLYPRRYSIDVVVASQPGITENKEAGWPQEDEEDFSMPQSPAEQLLQAPVQWGDYEALNIRGSHLRLPNPLRFAGLNSCFRYRTYSKPPFDNNTYLTIGDSTLSNSDIWQVRKLTYPDGWWNDAILNTALEFLNLDNDCKSLGIAIANSMTCEILHNVAVYDWDPAECVMYKDAFKDAKYILLPINDGYGGQTFEGTGGLHWSLLVVNRCSGEAHYIDSMFVNNPRFSIQGYRTSVGLAKILGDDEYDFQPEMYSPNQNLHNRFAHDGGACGPFVHEMMATCIDHIRSMREWGHEDTLRFSLTEEFPINWAQHFHSQKTRCSVFARFVGHKRLVDSKAQADQHNLVAMRDLEGTVELTKETCLEDGPEFRLFVGITSQSGEDESDELFSVTTDEALADIMDDDHIRMDPDMDIIMDLMGSDREDNESNRAVCSSPPGSPATATCTVRNNSPVPFLDETVIVSGQSSTPSPTSITLTPPCTPPVIIDEDEEGNFADSGGDYPDSRINNNKTRRAMRRQLKKLAQRRGG
ncbi:hypothetical protein BS50DRAFT_572952 [Corynespora cassiicola Philippines]|uniref:Ubiquitin-like protease family profile domain-containing protein n=1 Tax=Corynespora cassiicola Philippines TaxID=1448308 RepID=A0A2T2NRF2_CORCC|nr:hypothetical protein BS50DRAFT_572952 [Corynespora cassiicola Philippines]